MYLEDLSLDVNRSGGSLYIRALLPLSDRVLQRKDNPRKRVSHWFLGQWVPSI